MNIWIPRRNFLDLELPFPGMRVRGFFEFFKTYPNGVRVKVAECPEVPNLITNNGQNLAFTQASPYTGCYLGTGTATPAVTDTTLTSPSGVGGQIGGDLNIIVTGPPYQRRTTRTYRFNVGSLNGNYTEVAVGIANNNLFSRALIVDGGGTPTTLAVASTEQLDVAYTLCDQVNTGDTAFNVVISSVNYTGFFRRFNAANATTIIPSSFGLVGATAYTGTLNAFNSGTVPTGSLGNATTASNLTYVTGNYYRDTNISWNTTSGNGAIKSIIFNTVNTAHSFGMQFDGTVTKTNLQSLTLLMRLAFARV